MTQEIECLHSIFKVLGSVASTTPKNKQTINISLQPMKCSKLITLIEAVQGDQLFIMCLHFQTKLSPQRRKFHRREHRAFTTPSTH
jgi:hypothetical protein